MLTQSLYRYLRAGFENLLEPDRVFRGFSTAVTGASVVIASISPGGREAVKEAQVEFRLLGADLDFLDQMEQRLLELLCPTLREPSKEIGDYVARGRPSGGGTLFQEGHQLWERTVYMNLTHYEKEKTDDERTK